MQFAQTGAMRDTVENDAEMAAACNIIAELLADRIAALPPEAQMSVVTKLFADLTMEFAEPGKREGFLRRMVDEARTMIDP